MPLPPEHRYRWESLAEAVRPWRLYPVATCRSTNTLAARYRQLGRLFAPAVVVASRQTAGRGRGTNRFISDAGTLTVTFAYPCDGDVAPALLPLLAGLAVRDAAAELLGDLPVAVQLKWPNDVLLDGRKLAGLLCERVHGVDLIGVGLNVATSPRRLAALERPPRRPRGVQAAKPQPATSLELAGRNVPRQDALVAVARHLYGVLLARESPQALLRRYHTHHLLVGRDVTLDLGDETVTGRCTGTDAGGRLLVQTAGGMRRIISGQVLAW